MNEWNIRQKDLQDPHAPPERRSRRVAFCPTCKRPFLRGTGVRQPADTPPAPGEPEEKEYCGEECLPGKPA
jgi:hypothetical protein